jgi:hypothetical protein
MVARGVLALGPGLPIETGHSAGRHPEDSGNNPLATGAKTRCRWNYRAVGQSLYVEAGMAKKASTYSDKPASTYRAVTEWQRKHGDSSQSPEGCINTALGKHGETAPHLAEY